MFVNLTWLCQHGFSVQGRLFRLPVNMARRPGCPKWHPCWRAGSTARARGHCLWMQVGCTVTDHNTAVTWQKGKTISKVQNLG